MLSGDGLIRHRVSFWLGAIACPLIALGIGNFLRPTYTGMGAAGYTVVSILYLCLANYQKDNYLGWKEFLVSVLGWLVAWYACFGIVGNVVRAV